MSCLSFVVNMVQKASAPKRANGSEDFWLGFTRQSVDMSQKFAAPQMAIMAPKNLNVRRPSSVLRAGDDIGFPLKVLHVIKRLSSALH